MGRKEDIARLQRLIERCDSTVYRIGREKHDFLNKPEIYKAMTAMQESYRKRSGRFTEQLAALRSGGSSQRPKPKRGRL